MIAFDGVPFDYTMNTYFVNIVIILWGEAHLINVWNRTQNFIRKIKHILWRKKCQIIIHKKIFKFKKYYD